MIVPELPADIRDAEGGASAGSSRRRCIRSRRASPSAASIDPAELDALRGKARDGGLLAC